MAFFSVFQCFLDHRDWILICISLPLHDQIFDIPLVRSLGITSLISCRQFPCVAESAIHSWTLGIFKELKWPGKKVEEKKSSFANIFWPFCCDVILFFLPFHFFFKPLMYFQIWQWIAWYHNFKVYFRFFKRIGDISFSEVFLCGSCQSDWWVATRNWNHRTIYLIYLKNLG